MPWDNGVDKKAHINDVATTILKKPMPLTVASGHPDRFHCPGKPEFVK